MKWYVLQTGPGGRFGEALNRHEFHSQRAARSGHQGPASSEQRGYRSVQSFGTRQPPGTRDPGHRIAQPDTELRAHRGRVRWAAPERGEFSDDTVSYSGVQFCIHLHSFTVMYSYVPYLIKYCAEEKNQVIDLTDLHLFISHGYENIIPVYMKKHCDGEKIVLETARDSEGFTRSNTDKYEESWVLESLVCLGLCVRAYVRMMCPLEAPERLDRFYTYSLIKSAIDRCSVNMNIPTPKLVAPLNNKIANFSETAKAIYEEHLHK